MKRWYANLLMRWAFRVFRRYHDLLPSEVTRDGLIWSEIRRKYRRDHYTANSYSGFDPTCSTCVRELEEDRARQQTIQRWLKGKNDRKGIDR